MDFNALYHANFKLFDDAVTDWWTLVKHLEDLKKDAENGLHQAANKADWAGVNAQVSKEFIGKTAGEFGDAHTQASTIHDILSDTRNELKSYHTQLTEAVTRGQKKGMTVTSGGQGGFTVSGTTRPDWASDPSGNTSAVSQKDVEGLRDEIQGILDKASESDDSAKTVLTALADQSKMGFSDARYKSRDAAADAVKEADELARLAKKDPDDLSVKDFDRLNAGLKKYHDDPLFSERFATDLGPKKTLDFWAGLSDAYRGNYDVKHERLDQFDDLQRNLGLTLAHATQSDSAAMTDWKRQMIDIGDKPVDGNRGGPMGFQVMSNLMRTGDYDDQFLKDYGTRLMATERKLTGNGSHENLLWRFSGGSSWLNRIGDDSGNDPLTGYLKGLSNSPDAATDFFNQQYISKDDPDNPFERDTDGNDRKGKVSLSNFQYLFEERGWPQETDSHGEDLFTGQNNLALALEAATTGHPAGELPTADTPAHDAGQAKLMENIVKSVSEDPKRLTGHGYMSDSMGQIAAEYMPDINRGLHAGFGSDKTLFPIAGTAATLGDRDLTRFLYTVGQNPEGYAAVNLGQHSYTTQLMQHHFEHPGAYMGDKSFSQAENLKQGTEHIARTAGQIEGLIGAGRAYQGELDGGAKDAEYNAAIENLGTWGGTAVGIGVGMATEPLTGPGGAIIGDVAGTAADEIIGKITEGAMKDSSGEVIYRNGEQFQDTSDSTYKMVELAARKAGESTGHRYPLIEASVATAAQDGFDTAGNNVGHYLQGEGIPRQLDTEED
ncbi:DUF6571 family protein [Streptomyces murinus]|uniref:AG2 protein n=1 Tax=Streptomyces murinus TaxID=33900 RepID=A0A7W3RNN4_STRMR|nr:DUF6571 family protein [Streptomyces murinus]MBA9056382.1 hypothetical protein [Streptomyces murinus]UWW90857.1 hypothetical protein GO605_08275 [Streptomyces murinus]